MQFCMLSHCDAVQLVPTADTWQVSGIIDKSGVAVPPRTPCVVSNSVLNHTSLALCGC